MKVTIHYFAEALADLWGTPIVPIRIDVSPSLDVGALKYMACYASDLIEDMMVLTTPKKLAPEEAHYIKLPTSLSKLTVGSTQGLVDMFSRRRLSESLKVGELETHSLGMSIDINWLRRCPVCGQQNRFSDPRRVVGCDNIPDLDVDYACSNSKCNERSVRKKFDIRFCGQELPLITAVSNAASCAQLYGSKTDPPGQYQDWGAEVPELYKSEHCCCGAINPTDAHYCWNCGKKNKNVQPEPPMSLPYDLDALRKRVRHLLRRARS